MQGDSAAAPFDGVNEKLFALPDDTRVWPGHDDKGQRVSTIKWEWMHNARLANRSKESFIEIMDRLDLPQPRLLEQAIPAIDAAR